MMIEHEVEDGILARLAPRYDSLSLGFLESLLQYLAMVFAYRASRLDDPGTVAQYELISETFRTISKNIRHTWN